MPHITSVRLQNIRTHKDYRINLSPEVTVITGANGSGKTSIIEALYIAFQGSSFKGGDGDVLRREESWYRIDVLFDDDSKRIVKFDSVKETGRKAFEVNEKNHYRLPVGQKYPVVLFEPDDLRLLNGSPARRRQFLDHIITQLDPEYGLSLRRYERALKQRNTLLKAARSSHDDLFAWNVSLSKYGAYIISKRMAFVDEIQKKLGETYQNISHTNDTVSIDYSHPYKGSIEQKLLSELEKHTDKDKLLGFTSTGPHRHDVLFNFNSSPATDVASRGEIRTIILALKFIEVAIIETIAGKQPLILLDDVFSELDKTRQSALIHQFTAHQTVIASVNAVTRSGAVIRLTD